MVSTMIIGQTLWIQPGDDIVTDDENNTFVVRYANGEMQAFKVVKELECAEYELEAMEVKDFKKPLNFRPLGRWMNEGEYD